MPIDLVDLQFISPASCGAKMGRAARRGGGRGDATESEESFVAILRVYFLCLYPLCGQLILPEAQLVSLCLSF